MGRKANPAIIGAFVIGAVALTVVAVTVWGSGKLFRRQYPCVCYFPGSVNGLSAGAPVKFRGVQIGEVTDVRLLYAQARGTPRIPVFLTIDNERMRGLGSKRELSLELLRQLIDQGLPQLDVDRTIRMVDLAEYKRRQAPPGIKVTWRAFGRDRRLRSRRRPGR